MKQIETRLREGMKQQGVTGKAIDQIVQSITSFALYGFPESHAASFALLVYASAYLKAHYPAAFYTALLNNQPMRFYNPATLVKDAQRHGVRFTGIDVQYSHWDCTIEEDGAIRLGLRYVTGLREAVGRAIESARRSPTSDSGAPTLDHSQPATSDSRPTARDDQQLLCPKCGCDDPSMLEPVQTAVGLHGFCRTCAHDWEVL